MIPLSLAPANSAERSRGLLFAGAVLKLQGCRGFEGEKEKREGEKNVKEKHPQTCGAKCQREGSCCLTPA